MWSEFGPAYVSFGTNDGMLSRSCSLRLGKALRTAASEIFTDHLHLPGAYTTKPRRKILFSPSSITTRSLGTRLLQSCAGSNLAGLGAKSHQDSNSPPDGVVSQPTNGPHPCAKLRSSTLRREDPRRAHQNPTPSPLLHPFRLF